jgi:cytoskeletal protein CcmA (bactofilin family)
MALWKDHSGTTPKPVEPAPRDEFAPDAPASPDYAPPVAAAPNRPSASEARESVIGADLAIEGTISGNGSVRLAGRFTGDVTVDGTVSIEPGAKLAGGVRATTVTIAGELEGNVLQATRVDVLPSGAITGDVKADTLTIAAGSRVRGHMECGWTDAPSKSRSPAARMSGNASTTVGPSSDQTAKNGAEVSGLA